MGKFRSDKVARPMLYRSLATACRISKSGKLSHEQVTAEVAEMLGISLKETEEKIKSMAQAELYKERVRGLRAYFDYTLSGSSGPKRITEKDLEDIDAEFADLFAD